ncbi:MAG: hypothetical protein Q9160_004079 [Pyrenula sp. 1 TL-2023]
MLQDSKLTEIWSLKLCRIHLCGSFLTLRDDQIYLIRQSVKGYLTTNASAKIFPAGPGPIQYDMVSRSLQTISTTLRRNIYGLQYLGLSIGEFQTPEPDPLAAMRYSCVYWISYFYDVYSSVDRPKVDPNEAEVGRFLQNFILCWLEVLGLIKHMGDGVLFIGRLKNLLRVSLHLELWQIGK